MAEKLNYETVRKEVAFHADIHRRQRVLAEAVIKALAAYDGKVINNRLLTSLSRELGVGLYGSINYGYSDYSPVELEVWGRTESAEYVAYDEKIRLPIVTPADRRGEGALRFHYAEFLERVRQDDAVNHQPLSIRLAELLEGDNLQKLVDSHNDAVQRLADSAATVPFPLSAIFNVRHTYNYTANR